MQLPNSAGRFFHYLNMDYLIAPFLIRLIYWVGLVAIVGAGIGVVLGSTGTTEGGTAHALLTTGATVVALLLWRLLSEMLVLAFNIYARLIEIRDLLALRKARPDMVRKTPQLALLKNQRTQSVHPAIKAQHD